MKNLFLTSGLIACMACPAFADNSVTGSGNECVHDTLGVYEGTANIQANWRPNVSGQIRLDSNRYASGTATTPDANNTPTRTATPTPLYSVYSIGLYSTAVTPTTYQNATPVTTITTPQIRGYAFNGFNTQKDGTGTTVISSTGAVQSSASTQLLNDNDSTTWYAQWSAENYRLSYSAGVAKNPDNPQSPTHTPGGSTSQQSVTFDTEVRLNANGYTVPTGYTFGGWSSPKVLDTGENASGGSRVYEGGDSINPYRVSGDITLTAVWNPIQYSISYAKGSVPVGSVNGTRMTNTTVKYDGSVELAENTYTATGYRFKEWKGDYDNSTGNHTVATYSNGATLAPYIINDNLALTAQWKPNISGAISLDSNYYESSAANAQAVHTATTASSPSPLYSVYGVNMYSSAVTDANYTSATAQTSVSVPQVTGYVFGGFWTGKTGTGTQVVNTNGTFTADAKTTVTGHGDTATWYAKWTAGQYNVVYNKCASHATGAGTDSYTHTNGATYDASYTPKTYTEAGLKAIDGGYHFTQWKGDYLPDGTAATSTLGYYSDIAFTYQIPGTLTLTALCDVNDTIVQYSCGTAPGTASTTLSGSVPQQGQATFGSSFTFPTLTTGQCALSGYTASWVCEGEAGTTGLASSYTQGQTVNPWAYTGEHKHLLTCTANWSANEYFVQFQKGTAGSRTISGTMADQSVHFDDQHVNLNTNAFSVAGYTFAGWKKNNTGNMIANGADIGPYTTVGNTSLTAQWTANQYKITYKCGQYSAQKVADFKAAIKADTTNYVSNPSQYATYATYDTTSYALLNGSDTCELQGYNFTGWNCETVEGESVSIPTRATTWTIASDVVCTGNWQRNVIDLNWYTDSVANGGTQIQSPNLGTNDAAASCTYDGAITLPTQPTKSGYTFNGWTVRE